MRFRAELRSGWRTWLALAFLAGLAGGLVVAIFAGARRTDSALERHLRAYRFPDATLLLSNGISHLGPVYAHARALPQVAASALDSELAYCARDANATPVLDEGPQAVMFMVSLDGRDGVALHRPKLLEGRMPDPARAREALLDSRAARRFGVRPGDVIPIRVFPSFGEGDSAQFRCDPRNQNRTQSGLPTRREVRQILVECPDPRPCDDAEALMDRLYSRLERGADFAALARAYSDDPDGKTVGGRLWITRGEFVKPFDSTAFELRSGAVSRPLRTRYGWHIVQALSPPVASGPLIRLQVVGVKATTEPYPLGKVLLTPAFERAYRFDRVYYDSELSVRLKNGAADLPSFRAAALRLGGRMGPGGVQDVAPEQDDAAKIERSIHHQAQALMGSAAVAALLAFVLFGQALGRVASFAAARHGTLRALGMTRGQLIAIGVARAAAIAVPAAGLTVAVAAGLSPLTPIGIARELEPDPGFTIHPLVTGLGAAAVVFAVLVAGVYAATRASRETAAASLSAGPVGPAKALVGWPLPPTVVSGIRLALTRGRGAAAVPVGATLLASALAVGIVAVAVTFTASLDHLFSTPRLYGQNWDYRSNYGLPSPESVRANRSISDFARGDYNLHVQLNGQEVGLVAMDSNKGRIDPVVTSGRAPQRPDEILLAPKTLDALGLAVGDNVRASLTRTAQMRIVGKGVVPEDVSNGFGKGAAMTFRAYRRLDPSATASTFEARIAPEGERDATLARLERRFVVPAPAPPRTVADFGGVRDLPIVVSALLAAIAAASLAHTLVTAVRRRRRHLAVLKTLGFDRRQLLATVGWQAATLVAVGLAVGLPLGIAAGRWGWYLFAEQIGVVPEPVTPVLRILLVFPATFLLAIVVAALPAWGAARTRVAVVLRTE
jgi:putative ABC transport system permease protein